MTKPIPDGYEHPIPHLLCDACAEAIEFYKKAFDAEEIMRMPAPDGKRVMHAEIRIGGYIFFLGDDFPEYSPTGTSRTPKALGGSPVSVHIYVKDCDDAIKKAEQAGATVTMPPQDMFWGDRFGAVRDPFGHEWSFATHTSDPTPEEMEAGAKAMFEQS